MSDSGRHPEFQICSQSRDDAWDSFLRSQPHGLHQQSASWGGYKRQAGWEPIRIKWVDDGVLKGGIQILTRRVPGLGAMAYASRGPVLMSSDSSVSRALVGRIVALAEEQRWRYLSIQPPMGGFGFVSSLSAGGFCQSPFEVAPTATVVVDVSQEPEALMAQMRSGTRRSIRKALKSALRVREATRDDLPCVHALLGATARRQGFSAQSLISLERLWDAFAESGPLVILIAERDGEPVACELDIPFGDTLISKRCGWSGDFGKEHPTELLVWEGMQWARHHGFKHYEIEGIDAAIAAAICRKSPLPRNAERSPHWFKLGFGGHVRTAPRNHDRIMIPGIDWMHRCLWARALQMLGALSTSQESLTGSLRSYLAD